VGKTITTQEKGREAFNKAKAIIEAEEGETLQNHEALVKMKEKVFESTQVI